jgi:beta-N-acetylhexosaminidase
MATLREKIGQMLMVGCQGKSLGREEQSIIRRCGFGGFILFGDNCRDPGQMVSLCRSLWESATARPPFIAIDQEGGRVHRLPCPFTHFPAAQWIGTKADPNIAYQAGRATAAELALVGINLDFAPVLDVNSNPTNPVIGDRSFAANPAQVIESAEPWIRGLRDGGIIPCGKHFPGHGDTDKDSHIDLPVVDKSLNELRAVEFPPFIHACQDRIESLMTAHVVYPALDSKFPATLSHRIVTELLRQQWGYEGVVFSDDMEMRAISDHYGEEEAVALCVRAGVNMLLYGHELPRALRAFEFLCSEAERDPAMRAQVEQSHSRITAVKELFLRGFSGVPEAEIVGRLAQFDHQRWVDEIQGNL